VGREAASILTKGSGDAWAAEDVTQELDDYVSRRNKIIHGGDLKTGGSSAAAEPIQLRYVERAAVVVQGIGDASPRLSIDALGTRRSDSPSG